MSDNTIASIAALTRSGREDAIATSFTSEIAGGRGFAIARALKLAGYPNAAGSVVAATIAATPDSDLPDDLRSLSDAGLHLAAAGALQRAGLDAESRAELKAALELDPTLKVPDELAAPYRRQTFWRRALGRYGPALRTAVEVVLAALATAALLLLSVRALARFQARLTVNAFADTPESKVGSETTNAVRENYHRLRNDEGGTKLNYVASPGEAFTEPPKAVVDAYPQVGLIFALLGIIDRLLPSRSRDVSGSIRPRDAVRGVGLTLTFARRYGKVFEETTLWESDFGPPRPQGGKGTDQAAYDRLAVPAAVWLIYFGAKHSLKVHLTPWNTKPFEILRTRDWMSYALFAVGADLQKRGDNAGAQRSYRAALGREQTNRGAQFDLAIIELQARVPEQHNKGFTRLVELRRSISAEGDAARDPMWYRVKYAQTVAWMEPESGNRRCARLSAVALTSTILATLDDTKGRWFAKRSTKRLHKLLEFFRPATLVSLASTLVLDGRSNASRPVNGKLLRRELERFAAEWKDPQSAAEFDQKVTHAGIVDYVKKELSPLDAQTNYNLACYYTRITLWREATEHLLRAMELGTAALRDWAPLDSALEAFRKDPARLKQLEGSPQEARRSRPEETSGRAAGSPAHRAARRGSGRRRPRARRGGLSFLRRQAGS